MRKKRYVGSFCPMFGQTSFARLATEVSVRQTRCWTKTFGCLAGAKIHSLRVARCCFKNHSRAVQFTVTILLSRLTSSSCRSRLNNSYVLTAALIVLWFLENG